MALVQTRYNSQADSLSAITSNNQALKLLRVGNLQAFRHNRSRTFRCPLGKLNNHRHSYRIQAGDKQATSEPFGPGVVKELPIFPLSVIAYPTAEVPLNIFEARYRVLFSTLLAGSEGVEEELINHEKPWLGSRLFGMCYLSDQGVASMGTTLHIMYHQPLPDGRIYIVARGVEKFKIMKVLQERPVLICQVMMLEDSDDRSQLVQELAQHDIQLFKDLIMLNVKINKVKMKDSQSSLDTRFENMSPREVSYWLAVVFSQNPVIQQALLEEPSLEKRLIRERDILEASTKVLRAKVALQSAFTPEESISGESAKEIAQGEGTIPGETEQPDADTDQGADKDT